MLVVLWIVLIYVGLVALNFIFVLIAAMSNKSGAKEVTRADWLKLFLACLVPLLILFIVLNENVLYKLKPYWHYFDKADTPFKQEHQANKKMHICRFRMPYTTFLKHSVQKIKYFGLFTIYKAES